MKYPDLAKRNGIEGKVIVTFVVDSTGKAVHYKLMNNIGGGCDEEALRVIKSIPARWLPGILQGKAVSVEYSIPISFRLR